MTPQLAARKATTQTVDLSWVSYDNVNSYTTVRDCNFTRFEIKYRATTTPYLFPKDARILGLEPFVFPSINYAALDPMVYHADTWKEIHYPLDTSVEQNRPQYCSCWK